MKAHSSIAVANYLLRKAQEAGNPLTPMQLIKLVYICHGWMLGLFGRPLVREEVQAWKYGPVLPDLYHSVKRYRSNPVERELELDTSLEFDEDEKFVMDTVYDGYGNMSGIALSSLTHANGTPWDRTWRKIHNEAISNDLIQEHYAQLVAGAASKK